MHFFTRSRSSFLGLLLLGTMACTKTESPEVFEVSPFGETPLTAGLFAPDDSRDLIVVSIDTLRADRLPFYGAGRATGGDPTQKWSLSWLAENGTLFENTWSPAGMTLPAFSSFWTGLEPLEHGALGNRNPLTKPTFGTRMQEAGWIGHSVFSNYVLLKRSGIQSGFASSTIRAKDREPEVPATLLAKTEGPVKNQKRMFAWAHLMAPHQPYEPSADFKGLYSSPNAQGDKKFLVELHRHPDSISSDTRLDVQALYDEEVLTANAYVVEFLTGLEKQYQDAGRGGLLENAVIVFMSDHGEELLDHSGYAMHAKSIYAGTTRVPLIILGKDWLAGRRLEAGIHLADVLPLVLEGKTPLRREFVATYHQDFYALRNARWTLIHNPENQVLGPPEPPADIPFHYPVVALFDRSVDPLEQNDVALEHPEVVREMLESLHAWYLHLEKAEPGEADFMSEQEKANLSQLGYAVDAHEGAVPAIPWRAERWNR